MFANFGLLAALLAFASLVVVLSIAFGLRMLIFPERSARDRIAEMTGGPREEAPLFQTEQIRGAATAFGRLARPTEEDAHLMRRRLIQAGYRGRNNLELYTGLRVLLAFAISILFFLVFRTEKAIGAVLVAMLGVAFGYYIPAVVLTRQLRSRQRRLMRSFPDGLDLLVSSVEAGLGLDAAFRRVAREIETAAPELARELQLVNYEVEAGVPRIEALRHLVTRTGLDEVNALVNVLAQAERFGTSVARALRVHANLVRTKRMLAAEETAAQISPKLTVAMILFILPSLFCIVLGPAGINIARKLLPILGGGR
jgi:tight adherence protein C